MNTCRRNIWITLLSCISLTPAFSQSENYDNLPKDYLTPAFHAGRRQALRDLKEPLGDLVSLEMGKILAEGEDGRRQRHQPDGFRSTHGSLLCLKEQN
jgi:hypothetical protein